MIARIRALRKSSRTAGELSWDIWVSAILVNAYLVPSECSESTQKARMRDVPTCKNKMLP